MDNIWDGLLAFGALVVFVGACAIVYVTATYDHRIQYYYVDQNQGVGGGDCVVGYREWWPNTRVFCSGDVNQNIDIMNKMNQTLPKK